MNKIFLALGLLFLIAFSASAAEVERVMNPSFPGFLYKPKGATGSLPAIFLLHGSEGWGDYWGSADVGENAPTPRLAKRLAEAGHVTFAFAYFDSRHPGTEELVPKELAFIDLQRTYEAMKWFKREYAGSEKLTLLGLSRGAEQSLLLATLLMKPALVPEAERVLPDLVIALSPSSMVHRGISDTLSAAIHGREHKKVRFDMLPAWRWGPTMNSPGSAERTYPRGYHFQLNAFPHPIVVTHVEEDPIWGVDADLSPLVAAQPRAYLLELAFSPEEHLSGNYSRVVAAIRRRNKSRIFVKFPGRGHTIEQPYQQAFLLELMK